MKKHARILPTLSLVLLGTILLVGCPPTPGGDDDSAGGTPTAALSALSVEFSDLSFTHTFGASPCPQPVGTITLTNSTDSAASFSVADSGTHIGFSVASGTIPAGGSVTVQVEFLCDECVAAGFTSTVSVEIGNGAKTNTQTAPVFGTFTGCP